MRNIVQYPITHEEVVASLQRAGEDLASKQQIGGADEYILSVLQDFVIAHATQLMAFYHEASTDVHLNLTE